MDFAKVKDFVIFIPFQFFLFKILNKFIHNNKYVNIIMIISSFAIIIMNFDIIKIYLNDIFYFLLSHIKKNNFKRNLKIKNLNEYKILFLTIDNRDKLDYVSVHNKNLELYAKKWGYDYVFSNSINPNHDVYWNKIYVIKEYLEKNNWDYVVWLDSDTIIDINFDIKNMINKYNNHIIIGKDKSLMNDLNCIVNAGVFCIKNTKIGRMFLEDCIKTRKETKYICTDKKNNMRGIWTCLCYEQGVMNKYIWDKYHYATTVVPRNIINNTDDCDENAFILHLCGEKNINRKKCFKHILKNRK